MKLVLGVAVLTAVALAASACGSNSHRTSVQSGTSSQLILGGTVRCTATMTTPVEVGHELGVIVRLHNVSQHTVNVLPAYGGVWVVVRSADGTTYDTRIPLENSNGPPPAPIPLRPGATVTRRLLPDLRVRWAGPLRVTPGCDVTAAPTIRVTVTSPGLPSSESAAVDDVVTATGHLLDHCRPTAAGVSVVGRIDPPSHGFPPLDARCSITLERKEGFYRAQVLVLTPPNLRGAHVDPTYEAISGAYAPNRNRQVIAWEFVVTKDGATSVAAASSQTGRSGGGRAPDWRWSSSGPVRSGDSQCGFSGGSFGSGDGPDVYFLSGCGA
ncbi:MAG: hypothetical protein QOG85_1275 [Gaiellaceae bacterium]|jgi:hypothetical protein|nr:hypothetical protein [Gaiellaceae bacterium]